MKQIANKVLAVLVLVAMVVSIIPVHAFATMDDPIVTNEAERNISLHEQGYGVVGGLPARSAYYIVFS